MSFFTDETHVKSSRLGHYNMKARHYNLSVKHYTSYIVELIRTLCLEEPAVVCLIYVKIAK